MLERVLNMSLSQKYSDTNFRSNCSMFFIKLKILENSQENIYSLEKQKTLEKNYEVRSQTLKKVHVTNLTKLSIFAQ